ncbi:MAG TPA: hypothetical protein VLK37_05845 [Solirubrobacterales bacterium]|nr:hypothetical protein [Solirubrobacterales bacterium]
MRPITQKEAEKMRETLRTIAGFRSEGLDAKEPGQAAAILARETLDDLRLYLQEDAFKPR